MLSILKSIDGVLIFIPYHFSDLPFSHSHPIIKKQTKVIKLVNAHSIDDALMMNDDLIIMNQQSSAVPSMRCIDERTDENCTYTT